MSWSYAYAVNPGISKDDSDDACMVEFANGRLILVVSDGAGSAKSGGAGAKALCRVFADLARETGQPDPKLLVERALTEIDFMAGGGRRADYACTLIGAIATPEGVHFVQLGDGAGVFRLDGDYEVAIWPEEMEYLNVSRFITDADAADQIRHRWIEGRVESIALFSDGLQHLVIDAKERHPHSPFFERVFGTLNVASPVGAPGSAASAALNERSAAWLQNMLQSDFVTSRTDDDTSIVIAGRTD